jgi:hypothetical protein
MTTLALVAVAAVAQNATRFVHRHACYGADSDMIALDSIGCAEPAAELIQHSLTPDMLWCNATHCNDRFGEPVFVHTMDCDATRCRILLHCTDRLSYMVQAALVTIVGIFGLILHNNSGNYAQARGAQQKNL